MRKQFHPHDGTAPAPLESFGRIGRCHTPASVLPSNRAGTDEGRTAGLPLQGGLGSHALRSVAANGFGAASVSRSGPYSHLGSAEIARRARLHRSRLLGQLTQLTQLMQLIEAARVAMGAALRRLLARSRRRREERATYVALRDLDARTLHDLGIHRSELISVAAELASDADSTRVRCARALRGLD